MATRPTTAEAERRSSGTGVSRSVWFTAFGVLALLIGLVLAWLAISLNPGVSATGTAAVSASDNIVANTQLMQIQILYTLAAATAFIASVLSFGFAAVLDALNRRA